MKRKIVAAIVFTIILVLSLSSPAFADLNFDHSIYQSGCTNAIDPVNMLFFGNATGSYTVTEFINHIGWSNEADSTLYFKDHGYCTYQDSDLESAGLFTSPRDHVRFEFIENMPILDYYTIGAIHHDQCLPHTATDFNNIRNAVANVFSAAGHYLETDSMDSPYYIYQNCTDTWVSVDGYFKVIQI